MGRRSCFHRPRCLIAYYLIVSLSGSVVQAELGVSPMVLSLEAQPGTTVKAVVNAYVTSPSDSKIDICLVDLKDKWGQFGYIPYSTLAEEGHVSPNSCLGWISVDSSGPLSPNQYGRITIPVTIEVPADVNGVYYAALVIRETPLKKQSVVVHSELVVPVFLRTKGSSYPLGIHIAGIDSIKDFDTTGATLVTPAAITLTQQGPTNTYLGLVSYDLSTNFPAKIFASATSSPQITADWTIDKPPTHTGGKSHSNLKVAIADLAIVNLVNGKSSIGVGTITIRVLPDFSMLYTTTCVPPFSPQSKDTKQWFAAVKMCIGQEKKKIESLGHKLEYVRGDIKKQRQWLSEAYRSEDLSIGLMEDNEQRIEQAVQKMHLIRGSLANAEMWLKMARIHYLEERFFRRDMQDWLCQEALPWMVRFLDQLQQWQQQSEVIDWQQQVDHVGFLPTEAGPLITKALIPIPSIASIGLIPSLPQGIVADPNVGEKIVFLDQDNYGGIPLRSILMDLTQETHQMFIVDPAVDGTVNIHTQDIPLDHALDLICLSIDARWERYPGYYRIEPAPDAIMEQPYPFQNQRIRTNTKSVIRVDNEYKSYPFQQIIAELSIDTGIPIIFASDATDLVTAKFNDVPLEVALDILCISTGNRWKRGDDFYLIEPRQGDPLQLDYPFEEGLSDFNESSTGDMCWYWENTRLDKAVSDLAFEAKANIVLDAALDRKLPVTLTCENCSLEDVLDKLCQAIGGTWKKTPYFYWIMTKNEIP